MIIVHAKVAKLHRYLGEHFFDRVMAEISGANEEGLEEYRLDVNHLDEEPKFDLIDALEAMGYVVVYNPEDEILNVCVA